MGVSSMVARRSIPLTQRPVDILIILLYGYFLFSCIFIERHYCAAPLQEDDSDWIMRATYEYSEQYNPLFLTRPEWLQAATCISAYVLGAGYVFGVITFLRGIESMRIPLLMFCSFKLYAITLYYCVEFLGSMPPPDILMFLACDGAYYLGLALTMFRMRNAHPFSYPSSTKKNK